MTEDNSIHSELIHTLSKLRSAQRGVERLEAQGKYRKSVSMNLGYLIRDIEDSLFEEGTCAS